MIAVVVRIQLPIRILVALGSRLPARIAQKVEGLQRGDAYPWNNVLALLGLMCSSWTFYFLAWQALGRAFPDATGQDMLLLCATYTIAWVIGFLSLVTPSGLGAREAAFLLLSPADNLAGLAVLALLVRFWLLLIDVVLCLLFLPHKLPQQETTNEH